MNIGAKLDKQDIWYWEGLVNLYRQANKEVERLNNIINELEKYFFEQLQLYGGGGTAKEYYDKLQELKGSNDNE